jgi:hypothetical protein
VPFMAWGLARHDYAGDHSVSSSVKTPGLSYLCPRVFQPYLESQTQLLLQAGDTGGWASPLQLPSSEVPLISEQ